MEVGAQFSMIDVKTTIMKNEMGGYLRLATFKKEKYGELIIQYYGTVNAFLSDLSLTSFNVVIT